MEKPKGEPPHEDQIIDRARVKQWEFTILPTFYFYKERGVIACGSSSWVSFHTKNSF